MSKSVTWGIGGAACGALIASYALLGWKAGGQQPTLAGREAASALADAARPLGGSADPAGIAAEKPDSAVSQASLGRAILAQALAAQAQASEPTPSQLDRDLAQARATLDERMARSPGVAGEATRLRQAIQAVLDLGILGETAADVACGGRLCRVDLIDDHAASVGRAAQALVERAPKMFSNVTVYPQGQNQRAVYLAVNHEELMIGAPPEVSGGVVAPDAPPNGAALPK